MLMNTLDLSPTTLPQDPPSQPTGTEKMWKLGVNNTINIPGSMTSTWDNEGFITASLVFLTVLFLVKYILQQWNLNRHLPPGPIGLPFLGYLPFVERDFHYTLEKLANRYGKVFSVYLGRKLFIFIADHKLLRETFKREIFAGRPKMAFVDLLMEGYGVTSSEGALWREQRRFTQAALRDVGFTKAAHNRSRVEDHAIYNIGLMLEEMKKVDGDTFDMSVLLGCTVLNNFYALVAGTKPYRLFDPQVLKQIETNEDSFKRTEFLGVINFFPFLLWLPPFKRNLSILYNYKIEFHQKTRPLIAKHDASLDVVNPHDLIDAYLIQMRKQNTSGKPGHFSERQLLHLLGDLFGAGLGTTTTTLSWFFLAMMKYPDIQRKVQEELDMVVGRERKPALNDLPNLPYTEAVLLETQRFATILPAGIAHATTQDTYLGNFFVPKGTAVSGLFWSFHRDPKFWRNPNQFDPTHFLTKDGKVFKPECFMPFSVGRRICLGEDVARTNLVLIATHIVQEFTLHLPPEMQNIKMTHSSAFLLSPPPFKIIAIHRK